LQAAKITIIAGHYGSGKTTLAVNYAIALKEHYDRVAGCNKVALCDMDIVNPYFRTADHAGLLEQTGVELISSPFANTNVEMPWAPVEALRVFDDPALTSVVDLGGDDCGALAIGRYAGKLRSRDDVALWMVVNPYRPLTRDLDSLLAVRQEIEYAGKLRFTGLVYNANIGEETTADLIEAGFPVVRELSAALDLPIVMTAVRKDIALDVPENMGGRFDIVCHENRFGV